ncbi:Hypothetical predicted protein [Cloeon dipterum]|uniref:Uncharacterized protein n=1 Tax=Cloeon dipterum TaxID=197152 RepID=A0A8S1CE22_9INSE|nr:Hypothetical predicted protein [Cloeon dipterum]
MCSLVANYDSDEEQQPGAPKGSQNESRKVTENSSSEFGWSLMQANVQRDMEISDDDSQREEEIIPAKQLRRKKRIDFATSSNRFLPPAAGTQVEDSNPKTESSVTTNQKDKLLNLQAVILPSHSYTTNNQVIVSKGCDRETDQDIQLKLNECLCKLSSLIQRNCDNVEKAAAMLMKLQVLKDAWHAGALDCTYFCSQLDTILDVLQPHTAPIATAVSTHVAQQPLFPITKDEADQHEHPALEPSCLYQPPPPPPPEEDYQPAPPPPPPPPEVDEHLGHELDSFYSEMAGIEAAFDQKKEDLSAASAPGKELSEEVDPSKEEIPPEPVEMVNKNRRGKISSSVGMKRKNVSSLMEKWNKVKKEWND